MAGIEISGRIEAKLSRRGIATPSKKRTEPDFVALRDCINPLHCSNCI